MKTLLALANVQLLNGALADARDAVRLAAIDDAAHLNARAPDVYEMALTLENDGDFYRKHVRPVVAEAAAQPADAPGLHQWLWIRWSSVGRHAVRWYASNYATARDPKSWDAPSGAAELLAAYFQSVRYDELVRDMRAERAAGVSHG
jgi:hypothetical protein